LLQNGILHFAFNLSQSPEIVFQTNFFFVAWRFSFISNISYIFGYKF